MILDQNLNRKEIICLYIIYMEIGRIGIKIGIGIGIGIGIKIGIGTIRNRNRNRTEEI